MSHVTAKVASTLLIGVAAAAVSTAVPSRIVNAADSCLTEPKADVQGKHWYYHIERGTGRHCWYVRGQDDASARDEDDKQVASDQAQPAKVDPATARTTFEEGGLAANLPTIEVARGDVAGGLGVLAAFVKAGLAASNGEVRRAIANNAILVNDVRVTSDKARRSPAA